MRSAIPIVVVALVAFQCRRPQEPSFQLESFLQSNATEIPLNSALVWLFSEPVDPASVQSGGIRIEEVMEGERAGPPAAGRFDVMPGGRVAFLPKLASKSDLSDGGLKPKRRYRVTVDGFPRASGLRSTQGHVLESRSVFHFTTATNSRDYFEDRTPGRAPIIRPEGDPQRITTGFGQVPAVVLDPSRKLVLLVDEPLRPDTVGTDTLSLRQFDSLGRERRIPIQVRLKNLEFDPWAQSLLPANYEFDEVGARIEVELKAPLEPETLAILRIEDRVTDFGGNPLQGPFATSFYLVEEPTGANANPTIVEEFLGARDFEDSESRSPRVATATWVGDGRVTLHFPKIAASGVDGNVVLRDTSTILTTHAAMVELPKEAIAKIPSGSLITAQYQIWIAGELEFTKSGGTAVPTNLECGIPGGFDLVLVSGGDLTIEGTIRGNGSVLLAAGGAVRVARGARIECAGLRVISPGAPDLNGVMPAARQITRLALPDATNLALADALVYRATSPWIRTPVASVKFGASQWVGDQGTGRVRWMFRSGRAVAGTPAELDPNSITPWCESSEDLPIADRIQFRAELELPSAPKERPLRLPFVDRLTIPARRS